MTRQPTDRTNIVEEKMAQEVDEYGLVICGQIIGTVDYLGLCGEAIRCPICD